MSQPNKKKMKNTNSNQTSKMMELMQRNPDVARGFIELRSGTIANELWNRFGVQLNLLGPPLHEGKEWHKIWLDYKIKLKRKFDANRKETDGGGPYCPLSVSAIKIAVDELLSLQETLHPFLDDDDESDGETSDATSRSSDDGSCESTDVASENSDVTSETSDVATEISDVASETSDTTSVFSGVGSKVLNVTSESSDGTSYVATETLGLVSETSGVDSLPSDATSDATSDANSDATTDATSDATSDATTDATSESPRRLQTELLKTAKNIEKDIHDITKLMRKGLNLKREKLALLKAKEKREQNAYIDQLCYNKEKLDIKLLYLKLNMLQFLGVDN